MAYYRGVGVGDVGGWHGGGGDQRGSEAAGATDAGTDKRVAGLAGRTAEDRLAAGDDRQNGRQPDNGAGGVNCSKYSSAQQCGRALTAEQVNLLGWIESQCSVTRVWLDRLIAEGDPDDLVSVIHRQAAWLDLVRERLDRD